MSIVRDPLVSVMMPCYNSAGTLPLAFASLVAQTYENWECILVDDGSVDRPREVVGRVNDPRIRYISLGTNRGRGHARQVALEQARGELLCMLDSDDWLYPNKLREQVTVMLQEPELALVSSGMSVVNQQNELVGIRATGPVAPNPVILGPLDRLMMPPVAFPSSMLRMDIAKQVGYDLRLPTCEDIDFLIHVLLDRYYCVLPQASYVYAEYASVSLDKLLLAHRYLSEIFEKHRERFPVASRLNTMKSAGKAVAYRAAFALGQRERLIAMRSRQPSVQEAAAFREAQQVVYARMTRIFP